MPVAENLSAFLMVFLISFPHNFFCLATATSYR